MDVLSTTHRVDIAQQAIADALREGLLNTCSGKQPSEARQPLGTCVSHLSTNGSRVKANESSTS